MKLEKKQSVNVAVQHQAYSGPIPDPESLAKYETIQSGFAERIMRMAEDEAIHRRKNEIMLTKNIVRMATLGVIFAFLSVILFCGLILYALMQGFSLATLGIAIGAIASVAGLFIIFKSKKHN